MSKYTVIVSGGTLDESFVLPILTGQNGWENLQLEESAVREEKEEIGYLIAVDAGLKFLYRHQILPDIIVGDFDSLEDGILPWYQEHFSIPIRKFNPVKDASDTEIAIRQALEHGKDPIRILGGTGTRIDHIWANVQCLKIAKDAGVEAELLDPHNRIRLIDHELHLKKKEAFGPYFSLFTLGGAVEDLNITGAKYPLSHHLLKPYDSLSVSNQIQEEEVVITYGSGQLVLMETRD